MKIKNLSDEILLYRQSRLSRPTTVRFSNSLRKNFDGSEAFALSPSSRLTAQDRALPSPSRGLFSERERKSKGIKEARGDASSSRGAEEGQGRGRRGRFARTSPRVDEPDDRVPRETKRLCFALQRFLLIPAQWHGSSSAETNDEVCRSLTISIPAISTNYTRTGADYFTVN